MTMKKEVEMFKSTDEQYLVGQELANAIKHDGVVAFNQVRRGDPDWIPDLGGPTCAGPT